MFGYGTQAEKLQLWSSCKGATKCQIEMDFRVGGSFTQTMQIEGAGQCSFSGKYEEIVGPERILYSANLGFTTSLIRIEFIEQGKQTTVVLTQEGLPDQQHCEIISEGSSEGMEKLDALLALQAA